MAVLLLSGWLRIPTDVFDVEQVVKLIHIIDQVIHEVILHD